MSPTESSPENPRGLLDQEAIDRLLEETEGVRKKLPPQPSLEQLRKQAKDLLKAHRAGHADAAQRIGDLLSSMSDKAPDEILAAKFTLRDAQQAVAREYGFSSWQVLNRSLHEGGYLLYAAGDRSSQSPKSHAEALRKLHEPLSPLLSSALSDMLGRPLSIEIALVDRVSYPEIIISRSEPCCSYAFAIQGMNGKAFLDLSMPMVFSLLGTQDESPRELAAHELERLRPTVSQIMAGLEAIWRPAVSIRVADIQYHSDPQRIGISKDLETGFIATFEANGPDFSGSSGLIVLYYPVPTILATMEAAAARFAEDRST